jgi:hypothetical protein
MIKIRSRHYTPKRVIALGYGLFIVGLLFLCQDITPQILFGHRPSLGEITADSAIVMVGLAGLVIGKSLKQFDDRLRALEDTMRAKNSGP